MARQDVRTFTIDGAPWFVLTDVCRALELTAPHIVAKRLDQADRNTISVWSAANNRNYDTHIFNFDGQDVRTVQDPLVPGWL